MQKVFFFSIALALSTTAHAQGVRLTWEHTPAPEENIDGFRIFRGETPTDLWNVDEVPADARQWDDGSFDAHSPQYYTVEAFNSWGSARPEAPLYVGAPQSRPLSLTAAPLQ